MEAVPGKTNVGRWRALLCTLLLLTAVTGQPFKPRYFAPIPLDGESIWTMHKAAPTTVSGRSTFQSGITPADFAAQLLKKLSKTPALDPQPRNDDMIVQKTTYAKAQDELLDLKNVHISELLQRLPEVDTLSSVFPTSMSSITARDPEAPQFTTVEEYYDEITQMLKELSPVSQIPYKSADSTASTQLASMTSSVPAAETTSLPTDLTESADSDTEGLWSGSSGGSSLGIRNTMASAGDQSTRTTVPTTTTTSTTTEAQQTTTSTSTTPSPAPPVRSSGDETEEPLAPYIAFNIWSYEDGELKLSAVKKVPAEEVLGTEFYSKVTENPNDPIMVLSDSILINGNETSVASLSPGNVTKVTSSTENPKPSSGALSHDFTALVGELGLSTSDQQLLERLLNSANTIPETLTPPIDNIFDFVSYIVDGPPAERSTSPPRTEPSQNLEPTTTVLPSTTVPTSYLSTTDASSQSETADETKSDFVSENSDPFFSNVVITPEGIQIFNESQGHPAEQPVQQVLSQLDSDGFIFNINQSSTEPHVMKISLLSDDGIPIDPSLLQNANLISIISNKPTIVNHNIYQIHQSGVPDPIPQKVNPSEQLFRIPSTTTTMETPTSTSTDAPQSSDSSPIEKDPSEIFPSFTPEEQLFFELERITSFSNILNGGVNLTSLRNVSALESLALKGIFDTKPELLQAAKKQNSVSKREPVSLQAGKKKNSVSEREPVSTVVDPEEPETSGPESTPTVHALQLDVLPLGISDDSISAGQLGVDKNTDLEILENLLRDQKLPKIVERAILLDIVAGKPVSECILTNINKYWGEIEEHLKKISPLDSGESPLAVIEDLEKKLTEENTSTVLSNDTTSPHTFLTRVNVADPPKNTTDEAPTTSPNLQNCFKDRACTFAFSIALAAGTTGALSVPFLTPVLGRSLKTSVVISKSQVPNELISVEDAEKVIAAITKYSQRNGKTLRGNHVNLRRYMSPFVSYLGHKLFPAMFGAIPKH